MDDKFNFGLNFSNFYKKGPKPQKPGWQKSVSSENFRPLVSPFELSAKSEPKQPAFQQVNDLGNYPPTVENEDEFNIIEYLAVLLHRRLTLIAVFCLVMGVLMILRINSRPLYSSQAALRVMEYYSSIDAFNTFFPVNNAIYTHLENLHAPQFLEKVRELLDTNISTNALADMYKLKREEKSSMIKILATSPNPNFATKLANGVAQAYEQYDYALKQQNFKDFENRIRRKLRKRRSVLNQYETKVKEFYERNPVFYAEGKSKVELGEKELKEILLRIEEMKKKSEIMSNAIAKLDSQIIRKLNMTEPLQEELIALKLEKTRLSAQYGEKHRVMRMIQKKIDTVFELINADTKNKNLDPSILAANPDYFSMVTELQNVRNEITIMETKKSEVKKALDDSYESLASAPNLELRFNKLMRRKQSIEKIVTLLEEKLQETTLQRDAIPKEIYLIEKAKGRGRIINKNNISYSLALVLALAAAVGVCFFLEYLNKTIKKSKDLRQKLGLEIMGVIPSKCLQLNKPHTDMNLEYSNHEIEPYRRLLTNVVTYRTALSASKSLLITSALQGEGKTTVSIFLATVAAMEGKKVLLIDADFRRAAVHHYFGLKKTRGLSDFILNKGNWQDFVQETKVSSLNILTAGDLYVSFNQKDVKSKFNALLKESYHSYDLVVVDSPPILSVSDTLILSQMVDNLLLIFRCEKTPVRAAEELVYQLQQINANVLGGVLNAVSKSFLDQYYYYNYYNYGYKYYSSET